MTLNPLTALRDLIRRVVKRAAPPPILKLSQWAERNRVIPAVASASPGRWDNDLVPYLVEIMDSVNDPLIQTIVFMAAAQVAKTEFILNVTGYYIDLDPCPILLTQPDLGNAEAFSKERVQPMIDEMPVLSEKIQGVKTRSSSNTILHKQFPGGHLTIGGANSPASLASKPVRVVLNDEIDRYPRSAGAEGDPVKLAAKRATTFHNRKFIRVSTPTMDGASRIQDEYDAGDQREYYVPCPFCAHMQTLRWDQLKWEKTAAGEHLPDTAQYQCEKCLKLVPETKKRAMLRAGKWIAKKPTKKVASFRINQLYSNFAKWGSMVEDFLEAKKRPDLMKVWVNTAKGETYRPEAKDAPKWKELWDRREAYRTGEVPLRAVILTGAVDVQKDRLEISIYGWNRNEAWLVDHVVLMCDIEKDDDYKRKLDEVIEREWDHEGGNTLRLSSVALDSGYATSRIYEYVRTKSPNRVFAIKGAQTLNAAIGQPKIIDAVIGGKKVKKAIRLWRVGTDFLKTDAYSRLKLTRSEASEAGYPDRFIHFPGLDEEFFKQLTAEELQLVTSKNGVTSYRWVKAYHRNEALDCLVYNIAAFHAIGLHLKRESYWDRLESLMAIKPPPKKTEAAAAGQNQKPQETAKKRQKPKGSGWLSRKNQGDF